MLRNLLVLLLASQLIACTVSRRCSTDDSYQEQRVGPPLLVPEDLAKPQTDSTYQLPPASGKSSTLPEGSCNDDPPPMPGGDNSNA